MKMAFIARLIRKSDGVVYSAELEAHPDLASALIAVYERYGLDNRIETIYPKEHHHRVSWDPHPMSMASLPPVEVITLMGERRPK